MAKRHRYRRSYPRRYFRRRSHGMTLPIAPLVGFAAGITNPAMKMMGGDFNGAVNDLKWSYLGIGQDGNFHPDGLMNGTVPLIVGLLVHKFVGGRPLNANAALSRANVPFIRI